MKYCSYSDVTSVYSLNSRKLPGRFSYGLDEQLRTKLTKSMREKFRHKAEIGTLSAYAFSFLF